MTIPLLAIYGDALDQPRRKISEAKPKNQKQILGSVPCSDGLRRITRPNQSLAKYGKVMGNRQAMPGGKIDRSRQSKRL